MKYTIYQDLDGCLASFDERIKEITGSYPDDLGKGEVWKAASSVYPEGNFFLDMPKISDADVLWDFISPYNPIILTATGYSIKSAAAEKKAWVKKHYGPNVMVIITRDGKDKKKYAESNAILIDDRMKAIDPWVNAGGIGILHTDALSTIRKLKELGIE